MERSITCLFVIISVSLSFLSLEHVLASESGVCSDVAKYNMPLNSALTIGNVSASKKIIAFLDPS